MSVKVVLRKKQKADGTYPLAIRISVDRKSTYTYVGQSILEKDWMKLPPVSASRISTQPG